MEMHSFIHRDDLIYTVCSMKEDGSFAAYRLQDDGRVKFYISGNTLPTVKGIHPSDVEDNSITVTAPFLLSLFQDSLEDSGFTVDFSILDESLEELTSKMFAPSSN